MGVLTGSPKGPIQLTDYSKNYLAAKTLKLKRKELELQEKLAEQKLNKGKTKGPPMAKFNKTEANFQDKFHSVHDEAMNQLDQFAINNADKLNPNSELYDIKTDRYFQNMQRSVTRAADHSNTWVTNGTDFLSYINEKDEYGNRKVDVSNLEQKPKYLNKNTILASMELRNEPFIFQDSYWSNDETIQQELVLRDGGDPENIDDYLVDNNGFFLSKSGGLVIELDSRGNKAGSGEFLIDDIFNQEISGDSVSFDSSGNLMYGDKLFFEHFDTGFFDKNKYQKLDKPTNFINELASKKLKFTNLLNQVSENKYEADNESIGKIRDQAISLFAWNGQTWGNDFGDALANQIARKYVSEKFGILESEVDQAQINAVIPMLKNNENLGEEFRPDGKPIKSVYDNKEIVTFNDYAGELILESYANQNRFNKKKFTKGTTVSISMTKEKAKTPSYNWATSRMSGEFAHIYPTHDTLNESATYSTYRYTGDKENITGSDYREFQNNTSFLPINRVAEQYITDTSGTFNGTRHAMVPIDSRTGKKMSGKWTDGNEMFRPSNPSDAKYCVIVPMYRGFFKPQNPDNIKRSIIQDGDVRPEDIFKSEKGIEVYIPMSQFTTTGKNMLYYSDFIDKAEEINNKGIYGKSGGPTYAEGGIVSNKNNWKLPGT
jgi:hypothetical protein